MLLGHLRACVEKGRGCCSGGSCVSLIYSSALHLYRGFTVRAAPAENKPRCPSGCLPPPQRLVHAGAPCSCLDSSRGCQQGAGEGWSRPEIAEQVTVWSRNTQESKKLLKEIAEGLRSPSEMKQKGVASSLLSSFPSSQTHPTPSSSLPLAPGCSGAGEGLGSLAGAAGSRALLSILPCPARSLCPGHCHVGARQLRLRTPGSATSPCSLLPVISSRVPKIVRLLLE